MEFLEDTFEARSIVNRLLRAEGTLKELVRRSAPKLVLTIVRLNVARLTAEYELLPRRRAA